MQPIVEHAFAKINLFLHVTGRRDDGYHTLDSLVAFAQVSDVLQITPHTKDVLIVDGPFATSDLENWNENLIGAAVDYLRAHIDPIAPLEVRLTKNLPVAAGLGGGSANAAAVLRALNTATHQNIDADMLKHVSVLGADVPMCFVQKPARVSGVGEEVSLVNTLPDFYFVLVNPMVAISTKAVFAELRKQSLKKYTAPELSFHDYASFVKCLASQRNDLQEISTSLCKDIGQVLDALKKTNADVVRMAGSGPTCFGLYETKQAAEKAAEYLSDLHPRWWIKATGVLKD